MKRKKRIPLLLILTMALALAACGGKEKEKEAASGGQSADTPLTRSEDAPLTREDGTDTPLVREDDTDSTTDLTAGAGTRMDAIDPSGDLQSQIANVNRNNMTPEQIADLEADAKAEGYEIDWNPDGSLVIIEDGSAISTSGEWPDNNFTKDLPVPKAGAVTAHDLQEDECMIIMTWTAEEAKAYAEELKKAGFDQGVEEQDLASMGIYTYSASNGEFTVTASYAGQGAIDIEPTDPEDLAYREENAGNQMTDEDLQKQLEEAQKELESMELPEGYEDLLGDIDLESLLQGMQ